MWLEVVAVKKEPAAAPSHEVESLTIRVKC